LQNPKVQYLECRARSRHQITRLHLHAFELTCCSVTNVCLWTTIHSPDARTSHLRTLSKISGPASAPFPFLASPRRTEVPEGADYYTANFDSVNTVSRIFFAAPAFRSAPHFKAIPSAGPRILQHLRSSSTALRNPPLQPRPASAFHLSGPRILQELRSSSTAPRKPLFRPRPASAFTSAGRAFCTRPPTL